MGRPHLLGMELVRLLVYPRKPGIVEVIGLPVDGEQVDRHLARLRCHTEPRDERVTVILIHASGADVGEHVQQPAVVLTMLLGQIADDRREFAPHQRFGDESFRIESGLRVPFTGRHEIRAGRQHVAVAPGHGDRRQLEEVTGQHHLQSTERPRIMPHFTAHLIDHVEQPGVHHRHLVDDEHVGCLYLAPTTGLDGLQQIWRQHVGESDAAPRVDGLAVDMRGGDAR